MAKNKKTSIAFQSDAFKECKYHYDYGFDETDKRATGRGKVGYISFNEADELFRSWIDDKKWPYDALIFDPRVFTFIFEKTSRLISSKPKGRLVPREGSDVLSAKVNNLLLDYQWDMANVGGTMLSKYSIMDINARKYGASFSLCKWRYEVDSKGKVVFDGPDMQVLNNRDIAHDLSATSIESCNWFQVRQYVTVQDLKNINDQARSKPVYDNLDQLVDAVAVSASKHQGTTMSSGGDSRGTNWSSRNREISGLEADPYGKDPAFKTIELVTEYRKDKWITFAPKHGIVVREIDNPYGNNEIPITMLRYYAIDDDLYGLSEIEPVKGLQKALNALVNQYLDEINQKLYTPIAIGPGVKQHTLHWGKGARWIMNNPMSDFRLVESRSAAAQHFQSTYSAIVSSMMTALGESSLGISNLQPFQKDKTATEVQALQVQRNARDNYNQIFLSEVIKRQLLLWHTMNQQLLFSDPGRRAFIFRITGKDSIEYFKQRSLHGMKMDDASLSLIMEIDEVAREHGMQPPSEVSPEFIPQHPVNNGTDEDPSIVPKLQLDEENKSALLAVEQDDIKGSFDFVVDVQSMTANYDENKKNARQAAVTLLSSNPNIHQLLAQEGVKPIFKELFITWLEDIGFSDADRFFENVAQNPAEAAGALPEGQNPGAGDGIKRPVGRPKSDPVGSAMSESPGEMGPQSQGLGGIV